jgi:hypothetical protein
MALSITWCGAAACLRLGLKRKSHDHLKSVFRGHITTRQTPPLQTSIRTFLAAVISRSCAGACHRGGHFGPRPLAEDDR